MSMASGSPGFESSVNLLTALQHGDSFFPGGGVAFSHGLETLHAEDRLRSGADLERFLLEQLRGRWAWCDRAVLVAAYRAGDDLAAVAVADRALEVATLPQELREGSRRSGSALLSVHSQLGTLNAAAYHQPVRDGASPGHLAACQGLLWRGVGLTVDEAVAAAAHVLGVGVLGAAIRLGVVGAVEGQRLLLAVRPAIGGVLAQQPPEIHALASYAPLVEVGAMRHEELGSRLFAN